MDYAEMYLNTQSNMTCQKWGAEELKTDTKLWDYAIPQRNMLHDYKIFMTRNYGCGEIGEVPATPVLATPGMLCTETFIQIGPFKNPKGNGELF